MKIVRILAVAAVLSMSGVFCSSTDTPTGETPWYSAAVEDAWQILDWFFVFRERLPADPRSYTSPVTLYNAAREMYTRYYTNAQAVQILASLSTADEFGMGVLVDSVASGVLIKDVFPNSPASAAGLQRRDTITAVGGRPCAGVALDTVLSWMSGAQGAVRQLTLKRGDQTLNVSVLLGSYAAPSVFLDTLDTNCAYIWLMGFFDETNDPDGSAGEMRKALLATSGFSNTILDLRLNTGGYVGQCLSITEEFVPAATPVIRSKERDVRMSIRGTDTTITARTVDTLWYTETAGIALSRKFYVLVDGWTASASEILVSCLHDRRPDVLTIGTMTYGKARGQVLFGYSSVDGFLLPDAGLARVTFSLLSPVVGVAYDSVGIVPKRFIQPGEDALDVALGIIASGTTVAKEAASRPAVRGPRVRTEQPEITDREPLLIDDRVRIGGMKLHD